LARAYAVLGETKYRVTAEKALAFLEAKLWDAKTKFSFTAGATASRNNVQLLESYASLLSGVIELYEATVEPKHLEFANDLAAPCSRNFMTRRTAASAERC